MKIVKFVKSIMFLQEMRKRIRTYGLSFDKKWDLDDAIWYKMTCLRQQYEEIEAIEPKRIKKQLRLACKLLKVDYLDIKYH